MPGQPLILWGGTGHAKVLRPVAEAAGYRVQAVFDRDRQLAPPFPDVPLAGGWEDLDPWLSAQDALPTFAVAIGGHRDRDRRAVAEALTARGLVPATLVHPRAWVGESARMGEGAQVLAMAAVCEHVRIGRFAIVNTNASIDHDGRVGDFAHIMPGAVLAGEVEVGEGASVGTGATVLPRIRIGVRAFVGAGAVVTRDVPDGAVVTGNPARPHRRS